MTKHRVASALAVVAAVTMLAGGARADSAQILTVMHQDFPRNAIVYAPPTAKPGPRPLVIALHGMGSTGRFFRNRSHFDQAAARNNVVVVYPDAIGRNWNFGYAAGVAQPKIGGRPVDDIGYITALIDDLVAKKIADPRRIFVAGMSRGGMMAISLACAMSERIAAIAVVSGVMTVAQRDNCRPVRPVPIMMISGTADRGMPFANKEPNAKQFLSALTTIGLWAGLHDCHLRQRSRLPHLNAGDLTHVELLVMSDCRSGATLKFYGVHGGGHRFPVLDGNDPRPASVELGPLNRDIEAAEEILEFFKNVKPIAGYSRHD